MRIAVIGGGTSSEHEVSLRSAASVASGQRDAGHDTIEVTIERDGRWLAGDKKVTLTPSEGLLGCDAAFPVLHGPGGEDGSVQGLLEVLDVPYAGSDVEASAICIDKLVFKDLLARHGIPLLGVLPYRPILSNPTLAMVLEGVHGETIHPGPDLDQVIGGVAIGAMEPRHMLQRIGTGALVIVPGDREDVIGAIVHAHRVGAEAGGDALGLVLTGGYRPRQVVLDAIRAADLFATIVPEDTYVVASEVHDLLVKTHVADHGKIEEIKALVWEYLFIDRILEVATEADVRPAPTIA